MKKLTEWENDFACRIEAISYDFETGVGEAYFPPGNCCDMEGCIKRFKTISRDVRLIRTYRGGVPDTDYVCCGEACPESLPRIG